MLLEFASGEITTIAANSELSIAGTTAFLADATGLTSNSALTGLSTITGQLFLLRRFFDLKVIGNANLTVTGLVDLDQFNADGGAQLSVGGTLTNSGTIDVGPNNNTLSAADTITAAGLSNTGTINLWGSATEQATLHVSAPAGFGTAGVERRRHPERRQSVARIRQRRDHDHRGEQRTVDRRHDGVPGRRVRPDEQQRADWAYGPAFSL